LLKAGKNVRILLRHNSPSAELAVAGMATTVRSLIDVGAQPVYGDLTDRASLEDACGGIETVITTATATKREETETLEGVDLQGTLNLIEAARDAEVKHIIYMSAYGSNPDDPVPLMRFKAACESRIQESGMDYTILLPGYFMEVWIGMVVGIPLQAGQPVTLVGKGDHKHSFVSEANVADFAAAVVDNPAARNQCISIGGPASFSWTEVLQSVGQAIGSQLPVNYVPPRSPVPLLPPMVGALLTGMETYESYIDMSETAPKYGVELTTLEEFTLAAFGPSG
jgi:NADH dehydrogenase